MNDVACGLCRMPVRHMPCQSEHVWEMDMISGTTFFFFFYFGPDQDELAYPVHHMVHETTSRSQGSELSGATMIPQMTVVTDPMWCPCFRDPCRIFNNVNNVKQPSLPRPAIRGEQLDQASALILGTDHWDRRGGEEGMDGVRRWGGAQGCVR